MDKSLFNSLIDISKSEASQSGKANLILEKARWASTEFCEYNRDLTMQIVEMWQNLQRLMLRNMLKKQF